MLKQKGTWFGETPKKKNWYDDRTRARVTNCERCKNLVFALMLDQLRDTFDLVLYEGVVDHIVPERLILKLAPWKPPHIRINLMTLCKPCHGLKTSIDRYLCAGDKITFVDKLRQANWPMHLVEKALAFYGI